MSEETVTETAAEETVEAPASSTATPQEVADKTNEILTEIKDKLNATPKADQPSPQEVRNQIRERIKQETSFNDQQMDYVDNLVLAAVAPIQAELTFSNWRTSKGSMITPEIEKGIKEELKQYPARSQNDPVLLEKVLLMELGKASLRAPKPAARQPDPIAGRKIVPTQPPATGLSEGSETAAGAKLSDDEKLAARKMKMTEAEYAQAKGTRIVSELKKK